MTRALPQASKRAKYAPPQTQPGPRQRNEQRTDTIRDVRAQKIQEAILDHVSLQQNEVIYAATLDRLVFELLSEGVTGASLRGKSMHAINRAFDEVQSILLQGVPSLTLHIEVGSAMLGIVQAYWPMTPFSLYSDDGAPDVPEHMLRSCRGKHAAVDC